MKPDDFICLSEIRNLNASEIVVLDLKYSKDYQHPTYTKFKLGDIDFEIQKDSSKLQVLSKLIIKNKSKTKSKKKLLSRAFVSNVVFVHLDADSNTSFFHLHECQQKLYQLVNDDNYYAYVSIIYFILY